MAGHDVEHVVDAVGMRHKRDRILHALKLAWDVVNHGVLYAPGTRAIIVYHCDFKRVFSKLINIENEKNIVTSRRSNIFACEPRNTIIAAPEKLGEGSSATKLAWGWFDRSCTPGRANVSTSFSVVFFMAHELIVVHEMVLVRVTSCHLQFI